MPYLIDKTQPLRRLLNAYDLDTGAAIMRVLGCGERKAYKRLNDVNSFTVAELKLLSTRGHIPIELIREAVLTTGGAKK